MLGRDTSDAEIIVRARKNLEQLERWGRWIAAWHIALAICMGLALAWIAHLLFNMAVGFQNRLELLLGFIGGVFFGTALHHTIQTILAARLAKVPDQRDRLLLQYYDAFTARVSARDDEESAISSPASSKTGSSLSAEWNIQEPLR